jgi:signal transduction histidine kinase
MLSDFLSRNRKRILALSQRKVTALAGLAHDPEGWSQGLPEVYDRLIPALQHVAKYGTQSPGESDETAAILRGEKMLRLGLTVSQVVHGYGAICQAITETAQDQGFAISDKEFNVVNRVLDIAIAEAVTAYERLHSGIAAKAEVQRLGGMAHELRNTLTSVTLAHMMIRDGMVGVRGETNAVLEKGLRRMRDIIDRSMEEVRLHSEPLPDPHRLRLLDLVDEVGVTAIHEGQSRGIKFLIRVAPTIVLDVDPQHLVSAVSNLVQNAIKFTKPGSTVQLRAQESDEKVTIEVEDECGGLPPGRIEELFKPFTQGGADRSGVGLGLTISRRAIELNGGSLSARDLPGKGCVFTIILPKTAGHKRPADSLSKGSTPNLPPTQPSVL